jgi:hypothetical protein
MGAIPGTNLIARPDVDALVIGETREWAGGIRSGHDLLGKEEGADRNRSRAVGTVRDETLC